MPNIHPTALVSSAAELADDVSVGPFAVIDGPAKLHAGVEIGGHCRITGKTEIGSGTKVGWGSIIGADPQDLHFDPSTDTGVILGSDNVLREYVTIHRATKPGESTRMGFHNFLMTGAHLAHDVVMGDHNILANNVLLAGHIHMGNRAFLGGASAFHQFIRIGDFAIVRGLASISQDVLPYSQVYGHNQLAGLNSIGLKRAGFEPKVRSELKEIIRLFFLSGKLREEILPEIAQKEWSEHGLRLIDAIVNCSKKGVAG